ncbi:MAG: GNAT family N-acetyltransferase [Puniceicoccaceae bacterium]
MIQYSVSERLEYEEYYNFLKRTDLGSQYPNEDLEKRIKKLLKNCSLSITARNEDNLLIGICFGLTDFSYFLFVTDLGVDRDYVGEGIGSKLMKLLVEEAGGEDAITVVTVSNEEAYDFYQKIGLKRSDCLFWKCCNDWTEHVIE